MLENWEAWYTLGTVVLLMVALMSNRVGTDTAMIGAATMLLVIGILDPMHAALSFAHPAVLTIAALFVVASGLVETGAVNMIAGLVMGRPKSLVDAQVRMFIPVAVMSAVLNNTPIVAMYLSIIDDWAKKLRVSPSKLFMPLSFAAILGGACTLIGTSSNIAIAELYKDYAIQQGVDVPTTARLFWLITPIGLPTAVLGLVFIVLFGKRLLPVRREARSGEIDPRCYEVEMEVQADSPIVGKSIEAAGLRALPGLFLAEIERGGSSLPAVAPEEILRAGDRLIFVGVVESVVDLQKIRGLVPATNQVGKVEGDRRTRSMVEAVVSHTSPLVRKTVRESKFRTAYNAAIIAVHRNGQRIHKKIGDIVLRPGDTLLLDTHAGFVEAFRNSDHFYLLSAVGGARPIRYERAWLAIGIMFMVLALLVLPIGVVTARINAAIGVDILPREIPTVGASFLGAMLMVVTRCSSGTIARQSINWQVLLTIGGALAIGYAMVESGAADMVAHALLGVIGETGPRVLLGAVFVLTGLFSLVITNKAAAVLMFPIAVAAAVERGYHIEPFIVGVMAAAACAFMTPLAVPTNLMVAGPGGYRFTDFFRLGFPLTVIAAIVTLVIAPLVYPFSG